MEHRFEDELRGVSGCAQLTPENQLWLQLSELQELREARPKSWQRERIAPVLVRQTSPTDVQADVETRSKRRMTRQ